MKASSDLVSTAEEHTKVKLLYQTSKPTQGLSLYLQENFNAQPPFIEEVCVMVKNDEVLPLIEIFLPYFEKLKLKGAVDKGAVLYDFRIIQEEKNILAYFFGEKEKTSQKGSIGV